MNDINPIARTFAAAHAASTPNPNGIDCVELSDFTRTLANTLVKIGENPVHQELVDRVRAEIEAGTYETDDKIDAAIDELLEDL